VGKLFGVELGEGLAGFDIGAGGGKPRKDVAGGQGDETGAFTQAQGFFE
jgi:hypothetical protein